MALKGNTYIMHFERIGETILGIKLDKHENLFQLQKKIESMVYNVSGRHVYP